MDQNKYVNYFIDNAMAMLHENIASQLQLKTQLRLAEELVKQKQEENESLASTIDQFQSNLESNVDKIRELNDHFESRINQTIVQKDNEISSHVSRIHDLERTINSMREFENKYNESQHKLAHMDGLMSQIVEMKRNIQEKEKMNETLNETIANLKEQIAIQKNAINNNSVPSPVAQPIVSPKKKIAMPKREEQQITFKDDF